MRKLHLLFFATLLCATGAAATILGNIRGIVHDPQHRPIQGAAVTIRAHDLAWSKTVATNNLGEFAVQALPLGFYEITVSHPGFATAVQTIALQSGAAPILHIPLQLQSVTQTVEVSASTSELDSESSPTQTTVTGSQIQNTPGAARTNSLAMLTDYVPGAYIVHDQLHIRGGHQVSWLVDGVAVPNTSIASNVGPQFDPKDIDYLEVQRGGLAADYGDRTFGVFNVVTRSGFERNSQAELVTGFGSFGQTDDQINFGDHGERFAYYASINANRSGLGLETPESSVLHDDAAGAGGFTSLIYNLDSSDQLRFVASLRHDHYQVPNTPDQQFLGIRDNDAETDSFANFSWVRTVNPNLVLTLSPFYHYNSADFSGGLNDTPLIPTDQRASNYAGGQANLSLVAGKHNARFGLYSYEQRDNSFFQLQAAKGASLGSPFALQQRQILLGNLDALFFDDQYQLASWLTLNGGLRLTHFAGALNENAASPRAGAAIRIPRIHWVLRGFYGRYYQAPPLDTLSGPLLNFALQSGFAFLPLRGERDEQYEFGLAIPFRGWLLDTDYFHTQARNFLDHDVLANSNIFFPLTIQRARIRGFETTLRNARAFYHTRFHLAYSHQYAEGAGGVTGGLTSFTPPASGFFFLDHDQRDTLTAGAQFDLPWRTLLSTNLVYGSGFLLGNGPEHLPAHTTLDLGITKSISERLSLTAWSTNLTNRRYQLDTSNTFGGTHQADPRQIVLELRFRFHY